MDLQFWRGRWPVGWAIAVVSAIFAIGWLTTGSPYLAWRFLGVRSLAPTFADLRGITSVIDCAKQGSDPYATAACDPFGRLFNHPWIWLHFDSIGMSSASTNYFGCLFIVLICTTLLLIYDTRNTITGALAFASVVSPPVLLLAERGNVDALMFACLVISTYLLAKRTSFGAILVQCAVITFLTLLKIYPIAGATVFIQRKFGYLAIALTGMLAVIGILGVIGFNELKAIGLNTPQTTDLSYGDMAIFLAANSHGLLPKTFDAWQLRLIATSTALMVAGIASGVALFWPGMLRGFLPKPDSIVPTGAVATSCVSVFCFSFLLGANFDYRLVFLVGALPMLLNTYDTDRRARNLLAAGAVVLFLWLSRISTHVLVLFEIMDWSLFVVGIMWLTTLFHDALRVKPVMKMASYSRTTVQAR
jgi:hypothetical protein